MRDQANWMEPKLIGWAVPLRPASIEDLRRSECYT
jgi:hypothetical protein